MSVVVDQNRQAHLVSPWSNLFPSWLNILVLMWMCLGMCNASLQSHLCFGLMVGYIAFWCRNMSMKMAFLHLWFNMMLISSCTLWWLSMLFFGSMESEIWIIFSGLRACPGYIRWLFQQGFPIDGRTHELVLGCKSQVAAIIDYSVVGAMYTHERCLLILSSFWFLIVLQCIQRQESVI